MTAMMKLITRCNRQRTMHFQVMQYSRRFSQGQAHSSIRLPIPNLEHLPSPPPPASSVAVLRESHTDYSQLWNTYCDQAQTQNPSLQLPNLQPWDLGVDYQLGRPVDLHVQRKPQTVLPVWINIWQKQGSSKAMLYMTLQPMSEESYRHLQGSDNALGPGYRVQRQRFSQSDMQHGEWHNYLCAVGGGLAALWYQTLFPNQVLHGARSRHNLRHVQDLADFLSQPTTDSIVRHVALVQRLAVQQNWGWDFVALLLTQRWGRSRLLQADVEPHLVMLRQQLHVQLHARLEVVPPPPPLLLVPEPFIHSSPSIRTLMPFGLSGTAATLSRRQRMAYA